MCRTVNLRWCGHLWWINYAIHLFHLEKFQSDSVLEWTDSFQIGLSSLHVGISCGARILRALFWQSWAIHYNLLFRVIIADRLSNTFVPIGCILSASIVVARCLLLSFLNLVQYFLEAFHYILLSAFLVLFHAWIPNIARCKDFLINPIGSSSLFFRNEFHRSLELLTLIDRRTNLFVAEIGIFTC